MVRPGLPDYADARSHAEGLPRVPTLNHQFTLAELVVLGVGRIDVAEDRLLDRCRLLAGQ